MTYLSMYSIFGLGFYTAALLMNLRSFEQQNFWSITRGFILGFLLWPIAILTYPLWRIK